MASRKDEMGLPRRSLISVIGRAVAIRSRRTDSDAIGPRWRAIRLAGPGGRAFNIGIAPAC